MSYHTEKTLLSIRSLVDEWSIRREGGKQSFFVLKEIDKLLSELNDAPPSRNELNDFIRAQNKALKDFQDEINKKHTTVDGLNDEIVHLEADLKASHTNNAALSKALEEANTTLYNTKNVVDGLKALDVAIGTIEAELSARKEDSRVLMKVVKAVDTWHRCMIPTSLTGCTDLIKVLDDVLEDYSNTPEGPVVTLKTPSMGTRVVSKNEEAHIIDEAKMEAVRMLVGSDMWVLHTDEEAVEDKQQKETIDELKNFIRAQGRDVDDRDRHIEKLAHELAVEKITFAAYRSNPLSDQVADRDNRIEQLIALNEALRVDMEFAHNLSRDHIAGKDRFIKELRSRMAGARIIIDNQATSIEGLTHDLDARNTVIKDFNAIEQKETDRLHGIIEKRDTSVGKCLRSIDRHLLDKARLTGKLEKIEKIAEHPAYDCFSTALDEITKIIQEE